MKEQWTVDPIFGCWLWAGKTDSKFGYGLLWRARTPIKAHIAVYEENVGPVPEGLVLDHRCREPRCVRPSHMQPMTQSKNLQRKSWRARAREATCPRGHDLKTNAVITPNGGVLCRTCDR